MLKLDMSVRKRGAVLAHRSATNSVLGPRGKPRGLFYLEVYMTEFWMGVGMIAGAPVFGIVSALLAVGPIVWVFGCALKKVPEENRAEKKKKVDSFAASIAFGVFSLVALVSVIKGFCFIF